MCPTNLKRLDDMKQVMKYTDHDHQDFWISSMEDHQQRGPERIKFGFITKIVVLNANLKHVYSNFDK
jgi:hypothetical protein